jgi:hypothetical protein
MLEKGPMNHPELDRILSDEADLVPSTGFVSAVMDAARKEASAPPPIPFPWKRALPGIAGWVLALAFLIAAVVRRSSESTSAPSLLANLGSTLSAAFRAAQTVGAGWIAAALLLSYVSVKLALFFAQNRT